MSDHNGAVFNHSCLKVPRNPMSKLPAPNYEQKLLNELENEARKLSLDSSNVGMMKEERSNSNNNTSRNKRKGNASIRSLIDFYDSIPDYGDVNHLSNKEFYQRLEMLKAKQKTVYDYLDAEMHLVTKDTNWIDDYKSLGLREKDDINKLRKTKKMLHNKNLNNLLTPEQCGDSAPSSGKETPLQPPSRRSVRIESPPHFDSDKSSTVQETATPDLDLYRSKSRTRMSSADSKRFDKSLCSFVDSACWDDASLLNEGKFDSDREMSAGLSRSMPSSPLKSVGWKDNISGITIPKPFQMTVRDEEDKIVDEIISQTKKPPKSQKNKMFRAHDVPIESRIPLFWHIMEEQERRRQIVKSRSKATLLAQMRPFSFTKRDEEIQYLTQRLSKSTPDLCSYHPPKRFKQFKAKPVPKNLFSNYIYQKMYEDEFYRALKKKIRAEEMLKAASLPPSMAKREKNHPKFLVCPRSYRDCDFDPDYVSKDRKHYKIPNYKASHERLQMELEEMKNDFITTSPRPFKLKTAKRSEKRKAQRYRAGSADTSSNSRTTSSMEQRYLHRSNLAAVLRIQSAKKKQEFEMYKRLEESRLREECRWREKIIRKKPAWQELAYNHEEDLEMRLQLRRDEERLRSEEHRQRMALMMGRVNQIPTLFERQSKINVQPKTRQQLIQQLYDEFGSASSSEKYSTHCSNNLNNKSFENVKKDDEDDDDDEKERDKINAPEDEHEVDEDDDEEEEVKKEYLKIYEFQNKITNDEANKYKQKSSESNEDKDSDDKLFEQ